MSKNKPLVAGLLTIVAIYLLISFAVWDLNAKNWEIVVRVMCSFSCLIFAVLVYSACKIGGNK